MSARFAVVGETLVDLTGPSRDAPARALPGGSPLNVAVGLARLEQPTALFARFSRDPNGALLRQHARRNGVELGHAVESSEPSTTARVHLDAAGVARYEFTVDGTADFAWTHAELAVLPARAQIVHFGSLASWLPPGCAVLDHRFATLRADGQVLISYDPNVRPGLQPDRGAARAAVERSITHAHVVKASTQDVDWLYPGKPLAAVAGRWLGAGPSLVVITCGAHGSIAFPAGGARIDRPSRPVEVVDTVGAGDAYTAGLLDALARRTITTPRALTGAIADRPALSAILDDAGLVAALTCARPGADSPTRAAVRDSSPALPN
jgi:fructokinase